MVGGLLGDQQEAASEYTCTLAAADLCRTGRRGAAGIIAAAILSAMAVPQVIPIARIPGHRTEFAGTWSRGQFLGNVLSQADRVARAGGDRINSRRWYAYLHEFDHEGNYRIVLTPEPRP